MPKGKKPSNRTIWRQKEITGTPGGGKKNQIYALHRMNNFPKINNLTPISWQSNTRFQQKRNKIKDTLKPRIKVVQAKEQPKREITDIYIQKIFHNKEAEEINLKKSVEGWITSGELNGWMSKGILSVYMYVKGKWYIRDWRKGTVRMEVNGHMLTNNVMQPINPANYLLPVLTPRRRAWKDLSKGSAWSVCNNNYNQSERGRHN